MIGQVMEVVSFLFLAVMRTPGGVGMLVVVALLVVLRWMLRDRSDNAEVVHHPLH